jgi:hypothetical protein
VICLYPGRGIARHAVLPEANHNGTIWRLWLRASWINPSTKVKSNFPSAGSISSQYMGTRTVLRFSATSFGQMGCISSRLEDVALPNSPPRTRYGLSSTTSCVALPCRRRYGGRCRCAPRMGTKHVANIAPAIKTGPTLCLGRRQLTIMMSARPARLMLVTTLNARSALANIDRTLYSAGDLCGRRLAKS